MKILEKNRLDTAFVQNLQHNYVKKIFHFVAELFYYVKMQPPKVFCKKKVFLKNSQVSQENTCVGVSFNKGHSLRQFH